ncbi:MAG: SET domain-containing protein-lysine N-methyltransferase [Verrucomicrobiota bacterium]|nr:SET domain-containing protein-lysine N-methyltransferase [Limisphaera sp.]MDW8381091.1 SET domain-containing protein-lysine N-methyltransferase [Verrucomicrobiota bacterium]
MATGATEPLNAEGKPIVCDDVAAETEWVVFRKSPIHGLGGFARKLIPAGTRVLEYVGEKIPKEESARRCEANNPYIFCLNDRYDLDGNVPWNPARFLNHSCNPNCESELDEEAERIWIVALRDIQPGEELTFNYGYDLTEYKDYPCNCGAPNCVGYIVAEAFFEHVRQQRALEGSVAEGQVDRAGSGPVGLEASPR